MYARTVYAKQSQKITIIVVVLFNKTATGVPNVADEEPGVCFGKIHARTAEARSEGEKIIRVLSASSGVFTKSKTNVEKG